MKAAVYQGKQRFEIQDIPMPQPGPGQVLVKVEYCGICGTDVHGFMFDVIEPGSIVGHEVSGTVVEVGSEITRWKVGDRVAGGGGEKPPGTPDRIEDDPRFNYRTMGWIDMPARAHSYAEYVTMDEWEPVLIPEGVADIEAAMTEPLATSILAVRRSGIKLGDTVGVLGAGPIGLFCVQAARAAGASTVIVAEPAEARAKAALELGADAIVDPTTSDTGDEMAKLTGGRGPNLVFDCAGAKSTLQDALSAVTRRGRVIIVALCWESTAVVPVDWIARDLEMTTVLGYGPEDWQVGFDLIRTGRVRPQAMLTEESVIPLEGIQEAFDSLLRPTTQIKMVIKP